MNEREVERQMHGFGKALQELVAARQQEERDRVSKEIIDQQIKILSATYDKASAYTNLIVIAGYASMFGLWSLTEDLQPPLLHAWVGLMMVLSAACFVLFEVHKMAL